jgi:hypothetical protein
MKDFLTVNSDDDYDENEETTEKFGNIVKSTSLNPKKITSFLSDRTKFISKLLKMCKDKLSLYGESSLVKGLYW